jgi:hypothetical protein
LTAVWSIAGRKSEIDFSRDDGDGVLVSAARGKVEARTIDFTIARFRPIRRRSSSEPAVGTPNAVRSPPKRQWHIKATSDGAVRPLDDNDDDDYN